MTEARPVLIVEDDLDIVKLLNLVVKRAGHEPILAGGGQQAMRLLRAKKVDLILLDLMMEDVNGWQVLEMIKTDEHLRSIPVIIVSARHEMEESERVREHAGLFECYVTKPFGIDDLVNRITQTLR